METRPRLITLSLACRQYLALLKRAREFEMMDERTKSALERLESGEAVDPRISRTEKIERKRKEMHVETRIQELLLEQERTRQHEVDSDEPAAGVPHIHVNRHLGICFMSGMALTKILLRDVVDNAGIHFPHQIIKFCVSPAEQFITACLRSKV